MNKVTTLGLVALVVLPLAAGCDRTESAAPPVAEAAKQEATAATDEPVKEEVSAARDGAESPEALFSALQAKCKGGDLGETLKLVIPEERHCLAVALDLFSGFVFMGLDEEAKAKAEAELAGIRKRHNVPQVEINMADLQDKKLLKVAGEKLFTGVDIPAYVSDLTAFMGRHSNKAPGKPKKQPVALGSLEVEGDTATGTVTFDDDSTKETVFRKIDGRWYLSAETISEE